MLSGQQPQSSGAWRSKTITAPLLHAAAAGREGWYHEQILHPRALPAASPYQHAHGADIHIMVPSVSAVGVNEVNAELERLQTEVAKLTSMV